MDKIKSLEIFKKVADYRSFTKAADEMEMPKSAISAHIARLEDEIGVKLFFRTTRMVNLTHHGIEFYERAQNILFDFDEAFTQYKNGHEKISGKLRIDMSIGLASKLIIPKLSEFMEKYPNLTLELSSTDREVDVIQEGFDCVLRVGSKQNLGLGQKIIGEKPMVNCASKTYIEKYGAIEKLEDLSKHFLVDYDTKFGPPNAVFEYQFGKETREINMQSKIRVNNSISYSLACRAGFGIIQVPFAGVRDYLQSGELVRILPEYEPSPLIITLITPQRRNIPLRTQVFIDWVESLMPEYCAT